MLSVAGQYLIQGQEISNEAQFKPCGHIYTWNCLGLLESSYGLQSTLFADYGAGMHAILKEQSSQRLFSG